MKKNHPSPPAIARFARWHAKAGNPRSTCCESLRQSFIRRRLGGCFISAKIHNAEYFERVGGYEW